MSGFVFHPNAVTDLTEIWEYIAAGNPGAADQVLDEIYKAIDGLVPFPQMGHSRSDLTSRPLRFRRMPAPARSAGPHIQNSFDR
jgi:plasmid stabilization system protein ParE